MHGLATYNLKQYNNDCDKKILLLQQELQLLRKDFYTLISPESDPFFNSWLTGVPDISSFNNNVGYLIDAPSNGNVYGRKNGTWTIISTSSPLLDGNYGDVSISGGGTLITINSGLNSGLIADGSVSNSEFQYLNGVTSNIQLQINNIEADLLALAVVL